MDREKFLQLLQSVLQPNTDTVKKATAILKKEYYPNPEALVLLVQVATSHSDPKLRQLASVQASSLISKTWTSVPDSHKPEIRTQLLRATFAEQVPLVRHGNSRLIAAIAKIDLTDGQWADLPGLLLKAASSSQVQEREVGTYLLFTILEAMGDEFAAKFDTFFQVYSKTIKDPESADVRMNTMLGLGKMAEIVDGDNDEKSLQSLQGLLPAMVNTLREAIQADNEEKIMQGFEVFQSLLEGDSKLLNKSFRDLITFMATIAGDKSLSSDARVQAQNFLISCVMYRKLKFQGMRIGEQMVTQILEIMAECGGSDEQADDDDELSLELATQSLLGIMASTLPPTQVVAPLIPLFKTYSVSPDPAKRAAGITALGTVVDGAPEFLDGQMKDLLPVILRLLGDSEIKVREAATGGVKSLADFLSESLSQEHQKFMAALVQNISLAMPGLHGAEDQAQACESIVVNCCTAIDSLVEGMEVEDIQQYLPELVPNLGQPFAHENIKIKSSAIGAVGSIADRAKENFTPFFAAAMNALKDYTQIKDSEEEMDLRSMTCDTIASMARAVGPQAFQQYVRPMMAATEEGIHLDHARLKETSYMFWATMAAVYKLEFKPFLPGVVQSLLTSLTQEEDDVEVELGEEAADLVGQEVVIAGKKVRVIGNDASEKNEDSMDSDDEEDDEGWADLAGVSAIAEEKEVALEALAEVMVNTEGDFIPYFQQSIEAIMPLIEHPFEGTRRAALSAMFRAYAGLWRLQPHAQQKWEAGLPVKVQPSNEVSQLGNMLITAAMSLWMQEDDKAVVIEVNRNLAETFKLCGPSLLTGEEVVSQVAQTLLAIITKQHVCQQEHEEDTDLEDDEYAEDDWYVIETALDVVAMLAGALGEQFAELWKIFQKPILAFASGTASSQRATAVGCIADIIKGMKSGVTPSTSALLKVLLHRMSDEDPLTKSNAAFATGLLVQHSSKDQEILKAYNTILTKLEPLLHTQENRQLDNAAGCVSRMILKHPDALPLDSVLPELVKLLPLKEDYEENEPVYTMIVQLYQTGNSTIQNLTPQLMPVLDKVMGPPVEQISPAMREQLTQLVKYVYGKQAGMVQPHSNLMTAIQ